MPKYNLDGRVSKKKEPESESVRISLPLYQKLKLLTVIHPHTRMQYWANKAVKYALNHNALK